MDGIARVALFRNVSITQSQAAIHNLQARLIPTIRQQAGFAVGAWASTEAYDTGLSFSVFSNNSSAQAADIAINSTALLAGQNGEDIPSPTEVYNCENVAPIDTGKMPTIVRLAFLGKAANPEEAEIERRWATDEFVPFLQQLSGLCLAFMLLDSTSQTRISLSFWENVEAMQHSGEAIGKWSHNQVQQGRRGAYTPIEALVFPFIVDVVRGETVSSR